MKARQQGLMKAREKFQRRKQLVEKRMAQQKGKAKPSILRKRPVKKKIIKKVGPITSQLQKILGEKEKGIKPIVPVQQQIADYQKKFEPSKNFQAITSLVKPKPFQDVTFPNEPKISLFNPQGIKPTLSLTGQPKMPTISSGIGQKMSLFSAHAPLQQKETMFSGEKQLPDVQKQLEQKLKEYEEKLKQQEKKAEEIIQAQKTSQFTDKLSQKDKESAESKQMFLLKEKETAELRTELSKNNEARLKQYDEMFKMKSDIEKTSYDRLLAESKKHEEEAIKMKKEYEDILIKGVTSNAMLDAKNQLIEKMTILNEQALKMKDEVTAKEIQIKVNELKDLKQISSENFQQYKDFAKDVKDFGEKKVTEQQKHYEEIVKEHKEIKSQVVEDLKRQQDIAQKTLESVRYDAQQFKEQAAYNLKKNQEILNAEIKRQEEQVKQLTGQKDKFFAELSLQQEKYLKNISDLIKQQDENNTNLLLKDKEINDLKLKHDEQIAIHDVKKAADIQKEINNAEAKQAAILFEKNKLQNQLEIGQAQYNNLKDKYDQEYSLKKKEEEVKVEQIRAKMQQEQADGNHKQVRELEQNLNKLTSQNMLSDQMVEMNKLKIAELEKNLLLQKKIADESQKKLLEKETEDFNQKLQEKQKILSQSESEKIVLKQQADNLLKVQQQQLLYQKEAEEQIKNAEIEMKNLQNKFEKEAQNLKDQVNKDIQQNNLQNFQIYQSHLNNVKQDVNSNIQQLQQNVQSQIQNQQQIIQESNNIMQNALQAPNISYSQQTTYNKNYIFNQNEMEKLNKQQQQFQSQIENVEEEVQDQQKAIEQQIKLQIEESQIIPEEDITYQQKVQENYYEQISQQFITQFENYQKEQEKINQKILEVYNSFDQQSITNLIERMSDQVDNFLALKKQISEQDAAIQNKILQSTVYQKIIKNLDVWDNFFNFWMNPDIPEYKSFFKVDIAQKLILKYAQAFDKQNTQYYQLVQFELEQQKQQQYQKESEKKQQIQYQKQEISPQEQQIFDHLLAAIQDDEAKQKNLEQKFTQLNSGQYKIFKQIDEYIDNQLQSFLIKTSYQKFPKELMSLFEQGKNNIDDSKELENQIQQLINKTNIDLQNLYNVQYNQETKQQLIETMNELLGKMQIQLETIQQFIENDKVTIEDKSAHLEQKFKSIEDLTKENPRLQSKFKELYQNNLFKIEALIAQ